ncbi:hypothetical protein KUM39_05990 [Streptomyces sp. J2-1]|uniref:hypothetical protein n=1 Tax=Streptomyces corallincola TaxID=2851888 RepID=UPI001C392E2A|nr:hypothetical protein [Streptomyces corallincola]MBV2353913.1 hypothetical protein [Streptomyces corallincola]
MTEGTEHPPAVPGLPSDPPPSHGIGFTEAERKKPGRAGRLPADVITRSADRALVPTGTPVDPAEEPGKSSVTAAAGTATAEGVAENRPAHPAHAVRDRVREPGHQHKERVTA